MKKFREAEVSRSSKLGKYLVTPKYINPKNESFLPFFLERDGIGRLLPPHTYRTERRSIIRVATDVSVESGKKTGVLTGIYGEYVAYSARSHVEEPKTIDRKIPEKPHRVPKLMLFSRDYSQGGDQSTWKEGQSGFYEQPRAEPGKTRFRGQGSKYKLVSKRKDKLSLPLIPSYDTSRAYDFIAKRDPKCLIFKEHKALTARRSSPPKEDDKQKEKETTQVPNAQANSNNVEQDLYRILHSNSTNTKPSGTIMKQAYLKHSMSLVPDTEQLLKFNRIMSKNIDDMRKDLINFRMKLSLIGLKSVPPPGQNQ